VTLSRRQDPRRLSLGEAEDQTHHEAGEEGTAQVADPVPCGRVAPDRRRTEQREDDRCDGQRDVDEEDEPPADIGEEPAQHRADRGEEGGETGEQTEGEASSFALARPHW
jgi:hypothetical protein